MIIWTLPNGKRAVSNVVPQFDEETGEPLPVDETAHAIELQQRGIMPADATFSIESAIPQSMQDEIAADAAKALALAELVAIDVASVRAMREYIVGKADAPAILKTREAAAVTTRAKLVK